MLHVRQEDRKPADQRQERGQPEDIGDRGCVRDHADGCSPQGPHAEGKAEEKMEIAINLLKSGLSIDVISAATGLTLEQIEKLKSS